MVEKPDLEKFNDVIAVSLDELKSFIDQFTDILDPTYAKKETLPIIAELLNVKLNRNEDDRFQRRQIKTAVDLFKTKGTEEAIKTLFYVIGLKAAVIPLWTAEFSERMEITAPYIKIMNIPELEAGSPDIYVINPDDQYAIENTKYLVV